MASTLVVEFEGWYQYRLPTDPDPTDEPRGVSGYTFSFGDEPDLDRILRFQPDPSIPLRTHGPPVGVTVTKAERVAADGARPLSGLEGATVDLLDQPRLLNRNWVLTLPGFEPIVPFHLEIRRGDLCISREAPVTPAAPDTPIMDVAEADLTLYGARGLSYEPDTVAPAIGVWDPLQQYQERLAALRADRRQLGPGVDRDGPELAILDGRIAELTIGVESGGKDRRVAVRHVIERFGFPMLGRIEVSGPQSELLGGALSTDVAVPWRVDFWMGGFDPDALCAFVHGALQAPYAVPSTD